VTEAKRIEAGEMIGLRILDECARLDKRMKHRCWREILRLVMWFK